MRSKTAASALCGMISVLVSAARAQDYRPGDMVVVIADAKLTVEGKGAVDDVSPGVVLKVQGVDGERLWLSNGHPGWLDRRHVVPLNRAAIGRLTAMLRADPRNAALYSGRAEVWEHLGELDIAIGDHNEAIRLDPSAANYGNRGNTWTSKGEYDKAIADYNEAVRINPKFAAAYNNRGNAWYAKGEYDKAIEDYNEALRVDPKFAIAYVNRGNARDTKGEYDKAIEDYNEALRIDPTFAAAYDNRGSTWHAKGAYDKAIADYNEALKIDPKLADAYAGLAWLRATCPEAPYRSGKRAVADATKACELTGWKDVDCIGTLAAAYAESGDFEKAVKWQTKVVELIKEANKARFTWRLRLYKAGRPYREESK